MTTKKIGIEIVVSINEKAGKVEIKMSDRVHRSMISAVDSVVDVILDGKGKNLPRKFVENPKGQLVGTQTIKVPEHTLWRPENRQYRKNNQVEIPKTAPKVRYNQNPKFGNVVKVTTTAKAAETQAAKK